MNSSLKRWPAATARPCAVRRWVNSCAAPVRASRRRWRAAGRLAPPHARLRREEVAQLCGISVTWYTWIEQGREVSVSPSVWSRIAGVLQLARAERAYLFELADCADPQPPRDDAGGAPGPLRACVDAIRAPAYVLDRAWNLLAWNEPLRELFDDWPLRDPEPNLLRYIFLDPAARELVVDWEQRARRVVAEFRADAGAHLDEPAVLALADALNRQSPVFAHWWTRHAVVEREGDCVNSSTRAAASWRSSRSPFDWPRIRT